MLITSFLSNMKLDFRCPSDLTLILLTIFDWGKRVFGRKKNKNINKIFLIIFFKKLCNNSDNYFIECH